MLELPGDAIKSYQDLFPEEFAEEELKSTLKAPERQVIWDHIERMGHDLRGLKGIVQNPMPLTEEDVREWSMSVNTLIDKLMKMDANVKKLLLTKGIDI
jgi:hypothetical protein